MVHMALEAAAFLLVALLGTTGGAVMIATGAMLLVIRWMLRDKQEPTPRGAGVHTPF
jgi:hypothetical protein